MEREALKAVFGQKCASSYDQQWSKMAPLREALHLFIGAVLSTLGDDARILCVGAGTGPELIDLALKFPRWRFAAVEPSAPMLDVCRKKAEECGIADRCQFHEGYLESLPASEPFDAATSLLVSQFITDRDDRVGFFREIADRVRPGGYLINADLSYDATSDLKLLDVWFRVMRDGDLSAEAIEKMRAAYARDLAILPPEEVAQIISAGGFQTPTRFLQTGLIQAWFASRI